MIRILKVEFLVSRCHRINKIAGKLQLVFVNLLFVELRNIFHCPDLIGVAELVENDAVFEWADQDDVLTVPKDDFSDTDLSCLFQGLGKEGKSLPCHRPVRAGKIRRLKEKGGYLPRTNEALNFDDLRTLQFDFLHICRLNDHILIGLILITFDDVVLSHHFAAFLAALVVPHRAVAFAVKLIETDLEVVVYGVVDSDRNRHKGETNVTFPNGSHAAPLSCCCPGEITRDRASFEQTPAPAASCPSSGMHIESHRTALVRSKSFVHHQSVSDRSGA